MDHQGTKRGHIHRPGSGRRLARSRDLDRIDVKVEKFTAELNGGLRDLLSVVVGADHDLDAER